MRNRNAILTLVVLVTLLMPSMALAAGDGGADGMTNIAKALLFGLAAVGGTLGQGRAVAAALEGLARNPGAAQVSFVPMLLGLAFIESLVIFGLVLVFMM
jgi:F-type H+-transporting ATPase subunit c